MHRAVPIIEGMVQDLGGRGRRRFWLRASHKCRECGSREQLSCPFLDYNDLGGGGHNSDAIPGILAVSEREKRGGRDFITSLVISYELGTRVIESVTGPSLADRGWTSDIRGGLNMPPALGRLMGLTEDQIANAIEGYLYMPRRCTGHP